MDSILDLKHFVKKLGEKALQCAEDVGDFDYYRHANIELNCLVKNYWDDGSYRETVKQALAELKLVATNWESIEGILYEIFYKSWEGWSFDVILIDLGSDKLKMIKAIRQIVSLNFQETKRIVDNLPYVIQEDIVEEEAVRIKLSLENIGAKVKLINNDIELLT